MRQRYDWLAGTVVSAREIARGARGIVLRVGDGLPVFDPGSHVEVRVEIGGTGAVRTYSCLPAQPGHIRIAVKRHAQSRGGSDFMWRLQPGDRLALTAPQNRFELSYRPAPRLLMAGGIGVTPIFGMATTLAARGEDFRVVYGGRGRAEMALAGELEAALGPRCALFASDEGNRIDIAAEIEALPPDGELYVCGPIGMLTEARAAWEASGWPMGRLRFEVFGDSGLFAEQAFRVEVPALGASVDVRADQTMLDALEGAGIDMIHDCLRGECGLCVVGVLEHERPIDHRDVFFSDAEKATGQRMCACVSRVAGGRVVIDVGYRG